MMYGPSANNRVGVTSNESLFHLLKRPWDPFASHLSQNRPRKLPGNPVIVIVPSAPSTANTNHFKRLHKWTNLLSNLSTVVAVHTNIGNTASRMTMMNCADQMLAASRAKVQEVKTDYPGRPIVLVGFNAGSALALQVAQVEHVVCVVCLGFSLLTAEGKRGDPDDSLLELQCPVLFVIGQCSHTSLQEDLEDLRERMRVENGLIVVGSADDYLRVSKKKKRSEGITQNAVDRIIVENVGEFVSGLLLSPYPPQIRQSPTHVSSDTALAKRTKIERKRNNSNGSSIDSEPPSPTPKITRPVGRPPGSKSKSKLEAKWVAQVAQVAKMQAMGMNRSVLTSGSTLSNLLQSSNRPTVAISQTSKQGSGIKVLENLTLNASSSTKLISSTTGRAIDLSKITVLNSVNASKASTPVGNVVLMHDGKIKTLGSTVKGTGSTPILLPMAHKNRMSGMSQTPTSSGHRVAKYITSKKQLIGRRPPNPVQKPSIVTSYASNLPPPTNLTSQDIMDLPIIFADDNQMLTDNSKLQQSDVPVPEIIQPPKPTISNPVGKFVFINKQVQPTIPSNVAPTATLKRPPLSMPVRPSTNPVRPSANPVKYTKIILSRGSTSESKSSAANAFTKISNLSPEISIRKIEPSPSSSVVAMEDLENAIVSTTIKKPDYHISGIKSTTTKTDMDKSSSENLEESQNSPGINIRKRTAVEAELSPTVDEDPLSPKLPKVTSS